MRLTAPLLPRAEREALVAVVFDANAYGAAKPDLRDLAALALDLHTLGYETWVPEPVAWEWAEHVGRSWQAAQLALKDANKTLTRAGLERTFDVIHDFADQHAVTEAFLSKLASTPHVTVLPLSHASAVAGLKDQIMVVPPARLKQSVKTGASDSAWLREVLSQVRNDSRKLLIVSQDKDILTAFKAWKLESARRCTREDVRGLLFPTEPALDADVSVIARYLAARMPQDILTMDSDNGGLLVEADHADLQGVLDDSWNFDSPSTVLSRLRRLSALAGLQDVAVLRPESGDGAGTVDAVRRKLTAVAFFLADAESNQSVYDPAFDDFAPLIHAVTLNVLVRAQLLFEVEGDIVVSAHQEGAPVVSAQGRYDEPEEAMADLVEALSTVPGLAGVEAVDWLDASGDDVAELYEVPSGVSVSVAKVDSEFGGLSVQIGERQASVTCEYDVTAWAGGQREGMYMVPPYYLVLSDQEGAHVRGAWALAAWTMAEAFGEPAGDHR